MTNFQKKSILIIGLFALLHGLCCYCCRRMGIDDTRALTLLTITMILVIGLTEKLKLYYVIATIIPLNVIGYLMGSAIPLLLIPMIGDSLWVNVISTTITTLFLGCLFECGTMLVIRINGKEGISNGPREKKEYQQRWVVRINDRIVPVSTNQIAYFYSADKSNYLVTFDGGRYLVDSTMDSIMENTDRERFFRINRGCILSRSCIDSAVVNSGRYKVEIHPATDASTIVARSHVDEFVRWLQ